MATKMPGWLKFVVIGSGVLVLLGIGSVVGSFYVLRSSVRDFEAADRSFDVVAEQYGTIESFRPQPDGMIRADRLEAFLAARERVEPRRERMENALELLSADGSERRVLPKVRGTVGLIRNLAPFHRERNEALIESEIGLGEYYYLYTLAYYSWMGKSPADGPAFKIVGENGYLLEKIEDLEEPVVRENREDQARFSLNRLLLPVLRNQLAELSPQAAQDDLGSLRASLVAEIAALEGDPHRLPWEDGLPEEVELSLRPFQERLNDSYSAMCNAVEIGLARRSPNLATQGAQGETPDA